MALARLMVVGPLSKLARAAKRLEEGKDIAADLDIRRGTRSACCQHLPQHGSGDSSAREHINLRNEDMRLVLDNVGRGVHQHRLLGAIASERSRIVEDWFGPIEGTPLFWDYLRRFDPALGDYFEVAWTAVIDQVLPPDLCLEQLPRLVHKDGRTVRARLSADLHHGQHRWFPGRARQGDRDHHRRHRAAGA